MANILDLMDLKQILILHIDGISNRKISETIGIHRNTINSYVKLFNSSKYSKEELLKLEDFEFCKLFPAHTTIKNPRFDELMLFFKNMHEDLSHPGFTFLYHYAEYKGKVKKPYSYTQFMEHYHRKYSKEKGSMKLSHKPGNELYIDFTGKKLQLVDRQSGEMTSLEVFVAVLPSSQHTYVEACLDQTIESLITCTANALAYFGGVQANFFNADNPFNPGDWNWNSGSTYIGIGSGALSGAGMAGVQVPTLFSNVDGIITRGMFQAGANIGLNGVVNTLSGDSFFDNWEGAALSGFVNGAITGYQLSGRNGTNYWWGSEIGYNRNKWSFFNWDVPDYIIDFGIPNAGSNSANDCVPTTFAEIETKRGGSRTYNNFKNSTNYQENVGVSISGTDYERLVNRTFDNTIKLSRRDYINLFDAQHMQTVANHNEIISIHFEGHADNIKGLQVFTHATYKNKLIFRQSRYNFTSRGSSYPIINAFWFF